MAHFAELDNNNTVLRVVVISNADIIDSNGTENEALGVDLCNTHVGPGNWKQTSYNNNFRKVFGQIGFKYAPDKDVFYNPVGPFASWSLDANYDWQAPTPKPTEGLWWWDESAVSWKQLNPPSE